MGEWSLHSRWPSETGASESGWFHGDSTLATGFTLVASVLCAAAAMQANRPIASGL
jgi:hypothetical protein